jgi:hypothetical protein
VCRAIRATWSVVRERRGGVDAQHAAVSAGELLERGEPGDHPGVRGAGDRADDNRVEVDPEALLLLGDLEGPVRETQPAEAVLAGSRRDRVRRAAGRLDLAQRVLPRLSDADVEPGRVDADLGAHHPGQQDVADAVVDRLVPGHPLLLDQACLQAEVCGDGGHLPRVVGLDAPDRDEGVRPTGQHVGDDVLQLADLVAAVGQAAVDVLALGPHLRAAEVGGHPRQPVDRAGAERQRVTRKVVQLHER